MPLKYKIFSSILMVVICFILLVNLAVSGMISNMVQQQAITTMERAATATERYENQRHQLIASLARLVADSAYLKNLMIEAHRQRALPKIDPSKLTTSNNAPLQLILNSDAKLLFHLQQPQQRGEDLSLMPGIDAVKQGESFKGYWTLDDKMYQVAVAPALVADRVIGMVVSGYELASPNHLQVIEQISGVTAFTLKQNNAVSLGSNPHPLADIVYASRQPEAKLVSKIGEQRLINVELNGWQHYLLPIELNQPDHYVVLFHSIDTLSSSVGPIRNITLVSSSIALALGVVVSWLLAMRISRPMKELTDAAKVFGDGNLDYRVKLSSDDEIGKLANAFNAMAGDLQKQEEKAIELAYRDSLTNLPNRRHFNEQLERLVSLAKQQKRQIAVLFIDLDNFKRINDSLGHSAGDSLLIQLAERLSSVIRSSDYISWSIENNAKVQISRLGGDEFTVIIDRIQDANCVASIVKRVRSVFVEPFMLENHEVTVSASIGISIAPQDGTDGESLMKHADSAMYAAKFSSNSKVKFFAPEMEAKEYRLLKLESDIHRAIKEKEFTVHYQPFVDLKRNKIIGAEALVRWQHPKDGIIYPDAFIEQVEQLGVIVELGEYVLLSACKQFSAWRKAGYDLEKLAVNVSTLQLQHPKFIERFRHILQYTKVPPNFVEVEITESVLVGNANKTVALFRELQAMGVKIAIDDFGTGYSSLSYLKQYPINILKIDKSFVSEIISASPNTGIVSAIIAMAKSLNLDIVAEGVENDWHVHFLKQKQVNIVQGYFYSRPLPPIQFEKILQQSNWNKSKPAEIDQES
ncbi:EAL domain-containing protein [Paraferrimonas sedimenticola]|uniref:cyclic-guanylate-specific phosphodiesterase n=1 Tax=Paraferrimonas sedimenticola TaxID=375674 RepID=A0AA37RXQ3_9GAMM|nr:EAL domain-containing protein [Paraferrimonas sedimenticola]GLP97399.1 hypothetical protein GCM10007895_27060 [Paraferrimonas sedimenticola]